MPDTGTAIEGRNALLGYFSDNADWRRRKALEYPDDVRNIEAAELCDELIATVDKVPDHLAERLVMTWEENERFRDNLNRAVGQPPLKWSAL